MPGSARDFLFSLEQIGIKLGLDQIRALTATLGHPERAYPTITVAGTNGKGSVTAMVERGLRAAGYRTGRYTSPHLVRLEERVAIDGLDIAPEALEASADRIRTAASRLAYAPSFFEATTAMALDLFREARVDVAVLEVGLGGRLDATNVADARAVAITAIDFDHEAYLGTTITAIAGEKAGVIKAGAQVVLGENPPEAEAVVAARCADVGARLLRAVDGVSRAVDMGDGRATVTLRTPVRAYAPLRLALRGEHQVSNMVTAVRLLETVDEAGLLCVPADAIRTAVESAIWPARLELLTRAGEATLLDGAHNPAGARALARYLGQFSAGPVPIVLGVMRDKALGEIIRILAPTASHFIFTAADTHRAARPAELQAIAHDVAPQVPALAVADPREALRMARGLGSLVVVAGSLFLAGELRSELS